MNAVEKAISYMESKPFFNCARGGSLDVNDDIVMDAAIMTKDGVGFVGGVRDIEHPITLGLFQVLNELYIYLLSIC